MDIKDLITYTIKKNNKYKRCIYCNNDNGAWGSHQRWALLVICYHTNMVIYHYPLVGVIFMVILHVFIINNYPNLFSVLPLIKILGSIPFLCIQEKLYTNSLPLNITQLYKRKWKCYHILKSDF